MAEIEVNGAKLWYDVQGDGEPLFCIGGMVLVSNQFDFVTPLLSKSCKVINYDVRGVGKSAPVPRLNYRDYSEQAEDIKAIIDVVGLEKIHIWGAACSHIAVRFATRYPERTASVIFFPWFRQVPEQAHFFDAGIALCEAFGTMEPWVKMLTSTWTDKKMLDWAFPKFIQNMSCDAFKIHWNSMKNCDLSNEIPKIRVPTLMLMGSEESGSPKDLEVEIKHVEDNIPGVEKVFVQGSGRTYFMLDNSEKTSQIVSEWLKKHPIR